MKSMMQEDKDRDTGNSSTHSETPSINIFAQYRNERPALVAFGKYDNITARKN